MKRFHRIAAFALGAIVASVGPALAGAGYQAISVTNGGTITGTVDYVGVPPKPELIDITKDKSVCGKEPHYDESLVVGKDGGIANAVVFIADITKGAPAKPKTVTFDQKGCMYEPHVLAFNAGSTIRILNSDGILHNIHTYSKINRPINYAQPGFRKTMDVTIKHPELIKVTCDAHGWMEGWWYAFGNPYYARTGDKGEFTIKDVPPGSYTLAVWQEKLGRKTEKITVKAGQTTTVNFKLGPEKK